MKLLALDPAQKKMVKIGDYDKAKSLLFPEFQEWYSIPELALVQIQRLGIKYIGIKEIHTGDTLYSRTEVWEDEGRYMNGHWFLSINKMVRRKYEPKNKLSKNKL